MIKNTALLLLTLFALASFADEFNLFYEDESAADTLAQDTVYIEQKSNTSSSSGIANSEEYLRGVRDADADATGNPLFCFSGGCLGILGIFVPTVLDYNPPVEKLVGKSGDYILGYSKQYDAKMKLKNSINAFIGFVVFYGSMVVYMFVS